MDCSLSIGIGCSHSPEFAVILQLHNYWEYIPSEGKTLLQELQKSALHSGVYHYKLSGYSNRLYDLAGPLQNHLEILSKVPAALALNMKI